ncbi:unnamed protein product [Leptosia nina]|uniref:Cuticle protein n=1 Tax=Leptosia nina TaxID=320188 RepID=A0AAV1K671_9NEOP
MRFLVVLSILFAVSAAAPAEVRDKRTILVSEAIEPTVVVSPYYNVPALSHQARVDAKFTPLVQAYYTSPLVESVPVVAAPSVVLNAKSVVVPEKTYVGGSAVSQQSRVDVKSYPAVVSEHVVPTYVHTVPAVVDARSVHLTPVYQGVSAVSQQSRVDVKTSPAVVAQHVVSPAVVSVHSVPSVYAW